MILPSKPSYDSDFGGTKQDYSPIVDPSTDRQASEINAVFATVSALAAVSPQGIISIGFSSVPFVLYSAFVFTGATPTIVRNSAGNYTISISSSVVDFLGNPQTFTIKGITIQPYQPGNTDINTAGVVSITNSTTNTINIVTLLNNTLTDMSFFLQVW